MKSLFKILISFFLILLFTQCDKNDLFHDAPSGKFIYILNQDSDTICSNYYDKTGLLKKSISHDNSYSPGENAELNYTYNSDNLITKKTGYIPGIMYMSSMQGAMGKDVSFKYEYDTNDRLLKITGDFHYSGYSNIDYTTIQTFEYMNDKVIQYNSNAQGEVSLKTEYLFNNKGNIHTKFYYYRSVTDSFIMNNMEELTYDDYKAPFQVEPTPHSKNNVLSNKLTYYQSNEEGIYYQSYTSEYLNEYEYNIHGYPEKQTITYPNGLIEVKNYKY